VQLAMEVVLRMRFCGHCSAKLADYSISVKMRLFMSLLPSCRQDVALCIRYIYSTSNFFLAKQTCIVCGLHTVKPAIISEILVLVLAILDSVS